jgi:predicted amino acid-binding ACT domain protein
VQFRQDRADARDGVDDIRAGLATDVEQHRRLVVRPCGELIVLDAINHAGDVAEADRRIVLVADDRVAVFGGVGQLVVGADRVGLHRAVQGALGRIDVGLGQRIAHVFQGQAEIAELGRIDLHAHRRAHVAGNRNEADPADLRQLLGEDRIGVVVDLAQRQRVRGHHQGQDRRIGRIDAVVYRRIRQAAG